MTKPKTTKSAPARRAAKPAAPRRNKPKPRAVKARTPKPRKAGTPKPKAGIIRQRLEWRGVKLSIAYDPAYFKSVSTYGAHLEIRLLAPEGAPIPITDTGYRSHFLPRSCVEEVGGPAAYVRRWLEEEAHAPAYRRALDRWRQLELFPMPKS